MTWEQLNKDGNLKTVKRYDFNALGKATKTEQGYLRVPVSATRTGVLTYRKGDGTVIRELRPKEEVFKKESMETLGGVPLTNRHPTELLNSKNTKQYAVGFTSDKVQQNDIFLETIATITDQDLIDEIEQGGLREVSCGYECELEEAPGEFDGQAYDVIQRNIKYNHLAVVDKGRAGPQVRLKLDSSDAILENQCNNDKIENDQNKNQKVKGGKTMTKVMVNGVEYEASEPLAGAIVAALEKAKTEMAGAEKTAEDAKAMADTMKSEKEKMEAKADALEKEVKELKEQKMDEKTILARVVARRKVEDLARKVLPETTKFDEMTDLQLKTEVLKTTCPEVKLDGKSEVYVEARFDHILETHKDGADALAAALQKQNASRIDGAKDSNSEEARIKSMKADADAWKKPLFGNVQ